jgi:glucose/arabinose dehydrogenase
MWEPIVAKPCVKARRPTRVARDFPGSCADKKGPVAAFPAHWAPNGMVLYDGKQFPSAYERGAFIAFHGSWNRAPSPQGGYNVVFQPLAEGKASGEYIIFADGFAGGHKDPGEAFHRPAGLATGPDGALYISDDRRGRIWRVTFHGDRQTAGTLLGLKDNTLTSWRFVDAVDVPAGPWTEIITTSSNNRR